MKIFLLSAVIASTAMAMKPKDSNDTSSSLTPHKAFASKQNLNPAVAYKLGLYDKNDKKKYQLQKILETLEKKADIQGLQPLKEDEKRRKDTEKNVKRILGMDAPRVQKKIPAEFTPIKAFGSNKKLDAKLAYKLGLFPKGEMQVLKNNKGDFTLGKLKANILNNGIERLGEKVENLKKYIDEKNLEPAAAFKKKMEADELRRIAVEQNVARILEQY